MLNKRIIIALVLISTVFSVKLYQLNDDACFKNTGFTTEIIKQEAWYSQGCVNAEFVNTCDRKIRFTDDFRINFKGMNANGIAASSVWVLVDGAPYLDTSAELNKQDNSAFVKISNKEDWQKIPAGAKYKIRLNFGLDGNASSMKIASIETSAIPDEKLASINATISSIPENAELDYTLKDTNTGFVIKGKVSNSNNTISKTLILPPSNFLLNVKGYVNKNTILPEINKIIKVTNPMEYKMIVSHDLTGGVASTSYFIDVIGYDDTQKFIVLLSSNNYNFKEIHISKSADINLPLGQNIEAKIFAPSGWEFYSNNTTFSYSNKRISLNCFRSQKNKGVAIGGYYQSWSPKYTVNASNLSLTNLPRYIKRVFLSFVDPNTTYVAGSNTFAGTGLEFTGTVEFNVVKQSLNLLRQRNPNVKVLLSVGGASYNFKTVAPKSLIALMMDLTADGLDLDYEDWPDCSGMDTPNLKCGTDEPIIKLIQDVKSLLPAGKLLTFAAFSIGAYGTTNFPSNHPDYLPAGQNTGRLVNPFKKAGHLLDEVYIMSYDASNIFKPQSAFLAFKDLIKDASKLYLGFEIPPEAWGGHVLTVDEAINDATFVLKQGGGGVFFWAIQKAPELGSQIMGKVCELYGLEDCSMQLPSA